MFKLMTRVTLVIFFLLIHSSFAVGVTKAWLLCPGKAIKLNAETNTIEKEIAISESPSKVFFDIRKGNVFILHSPRRFQSEVSIYDVKTFMAKGKLDVVIDSAAEDDVVMLIPPDGNQIYLRLAGEGDGESEIINYDATTLKLQKRITTVPPTSAQLLLSAEGGVYSLVQDGIALRVDIFQTSDFMRKSSVNLKNFFTIGIDGGIDDYKNQKVLISEVISRSPQFEYFEYIYDIPSNKISQKIRTSLKGEDYLIPQSNKIALHELQYVGKKFQSMRLATDYKSSGKIHIYDATTGRESGVVHVNVAENGKYVGVAPQEDKLYFLSYGAGFSNSILHIIDLKTYTVIKEIPVSNVSLKMIFFDEL